MTARAVLLIIAVLCVVVASAAAAKTASSSAVVAEAALKADGCSSLDILTTSIGNKLVWIDAESSSGGKKASTSTSRFTQTKIVAIQYDHGSTSGGGGGGGNGRLYGILKRKKGRDLHQLCTIKPETGRVKVIGDATTSRGRVVSDLFGLAMDEGKANLYTYSRSDMMLYKFNKKKGTLRPVFQTKIKGIVDLAFHQQQGLIYAVTTGDELFTLDPKNRKARSVGNILDPRGKSTAAIFFAPGGGDLLRITNEPSNARIYKVATGAPDDRGRLVSDFVLRSKLKNTPQGGTIKCTAEPLTPAAAPTISPAPTAAIVPPDGTDRWNVLMISIDDLNDWVTHLHGHPNAKTPHIDALAAEGVSFINAHAPSTSCLPSRTATLLGLYPSTTGIYTNGADWHKYLGDKVSIMQHFKENGYNVIGTGKVFHDTGLGAPGYDEQHWTTYADDGDPTFELKTEPYCPGNYTPFDKCKIKIPKLCETQLDWGPATTCPQRKQDYVRASWMIDRLEEQHDDKPFFMALGFKKPHVPWDIDPEHFDQFPVEDVVLPETIPDDLADVPKAGVRLAVDAASGEDDYHSIIVRENLWKNAVQAYLAAGNYIDAQVGRVMDVLRQSPYNDSTIVVLWSDHGFHLGEKQHWKKGTIWKDCTHVPYIFRVPGLTTEANQGGLCRHAVDLLSLFQTLIDLTQLPPADIDGESVLPLLRDPEGAAWPHHALISYQQHNALRKKNWGYIQYVKGHEELYNHTDDCHEWHNLAEQPEYENILKELRDLIPKDRAELVK